MMSPPRQQPISREGKVTSSKTCHVAIIGSGLGGISAALAIINMQNEKKQSAQPATKYEITIYERDKSFSDRKEGYGMTLTYDPNGPLQKLGVLEEVAKRDCPSRCHYLFTAEGVIKGYFGNAFYKQEELSKRGSAQRGNLRIPRSELRSILWKTLQANDVDNNVRISFGKRLLTYVDRAMMGKIDQIGKKQCKKTSSDDYQHQVLLTFEDGTTNEVDLLIGADGVNSVVAKQYLQTALPTTKTSNGGDEVDTDTSPKQIGIFIILGITNHFHPHIDERGFYTLDGFHRLFIMPFEGSRMSTSNRRRTMWQLSFPADTNESKRLSELSQKEMQQEVLNRCKEWHEPFPDMVKNTPLDTVWGTALLDRDPQTFIDHRQKLEVHGRIPSRVMLLGDAAHAMSPFKGQGANNALQDGPLLAKWLFTAKLDSAVRGFMTEMSRRGGAKVRASREAAITLHSNDCWESMVKQDKPTKRGSGAAVFHGVESELVPKLLKELEKRGVTASLASKIDDTIRSIIEELGVAETLAPNKAMHDQLSSAETLSLQSQTISFASIGDLQHLRDFSRKSYPIIPDAKDPKGRSCLHVAAMNGHLDVCRWLLSEANISPSLLDADGKSALDLAIADNHSEVISMLKSWPLTKSTVYNGGETDLYKEAEKQLRGIRTMQQLRSMLKKNCGLPKKSSKTITRVLGCDVDMTDEEQDLETTLLAEEHGAFIFRNFVPRKVDQLALAALALRPLNLDYSSVTDAVYKCCTNDFTEYSSKSQRKQQRKQIENIKSQLKIPSDANIICQTNWGPQMQSYAQEASDESESALKRRKIDPFPLSKLRYLNLGAFNYNWGDRRYDLITGATVLNSRLVSLARHATSMAIQKGDKSQTNLNIDFNMAICNFYHLQRPSDRLGGHQDNVESNLSLPLVTISLGAPGVFLLGRETREVLPTVILLQAGDCMVLGGKSRGYFHGIPTILEHEDDTNDGVPHESEEKAFFPELSDEGLLIDGGGNATSEITRVNVPSQVELKFAEAFLSSVRMNMSIRQV